MKCESNKIGAWLDDAYGKRSQNPTVDLTYYYGAIDVLKVAGFKVDIVPCGRGYIHIVNPPDKVVYDSVYVAPNSQMEMELEV